MPNIIDERDVNTSMVDIGKANFSYADRYPMGLPLRPRTQFHDKLVARLIALAQDSRNSVGVRHSEWQKVDASLRTYVPAERMKQYKKSDKLYGETRWDLVPEVIMPVTYAALESMLSFMSAAFLEDPLFSYSGRGPEDILPTMLLAADVEQQARRTAMSLPLHSMIRDGLAYGSGFAYPRWHIEKGFVTRAEDVGGTMRKIRELQTIYEGNKLDLINPYMAFPDPNISAHLLEESEYFGWMEETSYTKLASMEQSDPEFLFNVRFLNFNKRRSRFAEGRWRNPQGSMKLERRGSYNKPVDVMWMFVQLIPEEWPHKDVRKFGNGHYPELWLFGVANDDILIAAVPMELDHAKIPVVACAPDYDGYNVYSLSRLWAINDLQRIIDFLFTSHVQNLRLSVNNRFIVDPQQIYMPDLIDNEPYIRTQRRLWGQGKVTDGIQQLQVNDLTRNNIADVEFLRTYANDAVGAPDRKAGTQGRGPRVSAEAIRGIISGAAGQMERLVKIIDRMTMRPLAEALARNTIQFRSIEQYVRLTGDMAKKLQEEFGMQVEQNRALVGPFDLIAAFDVDSRSGAIPGTADLQSLVNLFQIASNSPFIMQELNMGAFFKQIARQAGLKQLDLLVRQMQQQTPTVLPDEQVENQLQQGNIKPAELATNGALI